MTEKQALQKYPFQQACPSSIEHKNPTFLEAREGKKSVSRVTFHLFPMQFKFLSALRSDLLYLSSFSKFMKNKKCVKRR